MNAPRKTNAPPRSAQRLLAGRILGRSPLGSELSVSERGEILDSLAELYLIRRQTWGRLRSDLWYWWQAISFPAHESRRRFGRWRGRHERTIVGMFSDWTKDLRYAARGLAGNPGFTIVTVLALALGIGSLTPTFSLINAYLLRPLPFAEPERLVHLWETAPRQSFFQSRVSYPNFRDWRDRADTFEDMAAFNYQSETLTGSEQPERLGSARVSANVFDVLGVQPALGRGFRAGEDRPGSTDVVVLSDGYWQSSFGGDENVLGQTLELNGEPHTIIGVMPPEFVFPLITTKIWLPWALDEASRPRDARFLQVVGRLAPGVTMEEAQAEMDAIGAALPGVVAAATVNYLPLNHEVDTRPFAVPGREVPADAELPMAITLHVSPDYFRVMGVAVLAGRTFDSRDTADAMPVVMISELFAERHWPDADPIGQQMLLRGTEVQIVGVVADTKHGDLSERDEQAYLPMSQNARRYFRVIARVEGDPNEATGALRGAIWNVDANLPISDVRSLEQVITDFLLPQRMISTILGGLSLGAILLATIGIYGLIAFIVS